MIILTDTEWETLFDNVDVTITKAQNDLPIIVREKAEEINCVVDKYTQLDRWKDGKVLGCFIPWTNTIIIFVGQIYEDCNKDIEETMKSVRQVYYHELAHAVGDLEEYQVQERGL